MSASMVTSKKVVIIGDSNVGKTSILCRYCKGKFEEEDHQPTLGAGFKTKEVNI